MRPSPHAQGVIFSVNGAVRERLAPGDAKPSRTVVCLSGAIAGAANAAVVTPVELVRNRLQLQYAAAPTAGAAAGASYSGLVPARRVPARGLLAF